MSKQIDFNNLTDNFKSKCLTPIRFIGSRRPFNIDKNIKNGNISAEKVKEN